MASEKSALEFNVQPGRALGDVALGDSVNSIIKYIHAKDAAMPVEFKYNDEDPLSTDLVVRLPKHGLIFRFDPASQRLKSIEIFNFDCTRLVYQGNDFWQFVQGDPDVPPSVQAIRAGIAGMWWWHVCSCGGPLLDRPTYPGTFNAATKEYILKYPGITLVFPIPEQHVQLYSQEDLPLEFPDGTTPVLARLYIYHGADDWTQAVPPPVASTASDAKDIGVVVAKAHYGVTLQQQGRPVHLQIGLTDAQDLLTELGEPDAIWRKREDKLRIHAAAKHGASSAQDVAEADAVVIQCCLLRVAGWPSCSSDDVPVDYFFNYFRYGFDVLLDGRTHRCLKVILHTNTPGHYDFDRYRKCQFRIQLNEDAQKGAGGEWALDYA
ncbi:hypothetical protein SYNPS1DRAFT_27813 [Syncephalis pseudoplumigaleata]|uniref:Uncharacterized protein n=1 Tax=Syncephalis pseudoplumigaleata TaxID=1712513 RepID=A0A4P9Z3W1_9FUNG|nr:hypothetical protein SYNPS1DRAFT_27813 [Syncephalis pseudoplumigaleata]|eukprot:RKP26501.1 hypothetical protein SYNPS1DRAFT_27813 [Syncephalis pseudoplumigaleata]